MIRRISIFFLIYTHVVLGHNSAAAYDENGKRDPFSPLVNNTGIVAVYDADLSVTDLKLEGVMMDAGGQNLAIVNGKIVKAMDKIGPYVVESITVDHIELSKDQEKFALHLKKGRI